MGKYAILTIITGLFLSSCCPTVSVNPLSPPAELDNRLEGAWRYDPEVGDKVYLHFGKAADNKMVVYTVEHKKNGEVQIVKIPFFLTNTGMNNYLNIRIEDVEKDTPEDCKGYVFVKYVFINNDTLNFYSIEEETVISAIKEKKLKGKILYREKKVGEKAKSDGTQSEKRIDCVIITDTSENMIKFFDSDENNKIFSNELKFLRIK